MVDILFPPHDGLRSGRRVLPFPILDAKGSVAELAALMVVGFAASAATVLIDFSLRIPGHAIIRGVFPLVCGLALVPRRRAGTVMAAGALSGATLFQLTGFEGAGAGALTSLLLTGPFLDVALSRAKQGRSILLGCAAAGLFANLAAFVVRGIAKIGLPQFAGGRLFESWISVAAITYPLCGLLAGLLSAAVWFQVAGKSQSPEQTDLNPRRAGESGP